jgi:hypothetical protein
VEILLLISVLGAATGFLSGLFGIGGGIIMAPLLLYVPPLLGLDPFTMHTVAGLTIVQGLVACISGALAHHKFHAVSGRLALYMGVSIFCFAIIGGAGARYVSNEVLLLVFAGLALCASILMMLKETDRVDSDVSTLSFSRLRAVATAAGVGLFGGLVGQGGSFILIPLMTSFVKIPTRIAVGSNLAIVMLSTLAGFIGKAATGQIEWLLCVPIVLTVVPATYLGGLTSRKLPVLWLRRLLALLIAIAALRMCFSVLS